MRSRFKPLLSRATCGAYSEAPKLLNTFTRTKVPFVPLNGNRVGWYICGPTVYGRGHTYRI
jgi:cysteinyl-tRNA synthetase